MFDSIRYDPAARRLVIIAGVLLAAALVFAGFSAFSNLNTPAPTPIPLPTETPTRTPRPTSTLAPTATETPPPTDTPPPPPDVEGTATAQASGGGGTGSGTAGRTPLARPIRYVAVGASDTVGVGADNPDTEAWPVIVKNHLPRDTKFQR